MFRLAALLCLLAVPALGQSSNEPRGLLQLVEQANSLCRGMSGDNPETQEICEIRDDIVRRLSARGWCYGQQGQGGYQMRWHRCGPNSLRN